MHTVRAMWWVTVAGGAPLLLAVSLAVLAVVEVVYGPQVVRWLVSAMRLAG